MTVGDEVCVWEPKRRMQSWEQRFEDAVRTADETVEKLAGQG
jgi:hypothetical protein